MLGLLLMLLSPPLGEMELLRRFEAEELLNLHGSSYEVVNDQVDVSPYRSLSFQLPVELRSSGLPRPTPTPSLSPSLQQLTIPVTLNATVRRYIKFFLGRGRSTYAKWYTRMGRYRELIEPILEQHGVPREIIYLCMIESGFANDAVSRAAAVGPWQFILKTAQSYGLRYDGWVDGRRDFIASTRAAARHLSDLYRRFRSWPLAMAAYNAGVGSVSRAIRETNTNDLWRIIHACYLSAAGGLYVPKIMAAMIIGQSPARYGFKGLSLDAPLRFEVVEVPGGHELSKYARAARVSREELELFNPALRRGYVPPDPDGYALRVPLGAREPLERALKSFERNPAQLFMEHRLRFGEPLRDIAQAYRCSLRKLLEINEIERSDRPPPVGTVLLIPKTRQPKDLLADSYLVLLEPELTFETGDQKEIFFPVRQQLTLEQVASFFQTTPSSVSLWNGLDRDAILQRGRVIRLFVAPNFDLSTALLARRDQVQIVRAESDEALEALSYLKQRGRQVRYHRHRVRRRETLRSIAMKYRVTVSSIRAENGLRRRKNLYEGLILKIPLKTAPPPRGALARRSPKRVGRGYRIRRGDTLWKIARRFRVSLDSLRRINHFRGRVRLQLGQTIRIP
ncbi:MAG: LysM peptidoglycan-binding domain-containing protein [Myxococcota bacterium]|nr:LysM peptidoglycan-binding domain-containing protein [Myxococcota bacterium]